MLLARLNLAALAAFSCARVGLSPAPRSTRRALLRVGSVKALDLDGLRKESQRVLYRAQKKAAKAEARSEKCAAQQAALLDDADASLEALEALPNCDELRSAADSEVTRMLELEELVEGLQASAGGKDGAPPEADLVRLAATLGVDDKPPPRPPPRPTKAKGPRSSKQPRLPYRIFRSEGGAEIRVGKQAGDNDALSCDPAHRDGDDWWLHASGCPGSHVVIRSGTLDGAGALSKEVELDAAVLAANYSKAAKTGNVPVNLCRARQVRKPPGAKPGLVQLSGDVRTIRVNWTKEKRRLERLATTLD